MLTILIFTVLLAVSSQDVPEEEWAPEFAEPISNVTVSLGREAIFSCTVRGLGMYKVGWLRAEDLTVLSIDRKVVIHNLRISVTHDHESDSWRLHIRQVKYSDRGCYICQINTNTMKKQVGCLDVHVSPDILDTGTSSDALVEEGDNVTLTCAAQGHPFPRIVWRREDGKTFTVYNQSAGFTTVDSFNGSRLEMVKIDYTQMGAYLCIATNDIPPAVSKRIVLRINFAPVSRQTDQRVGATLGSNLSLTCKFHGFPSDNATWHRDACEIADKDRYLIAAERSFYLVTLQLSVMNLSAVDYGKYYCALSNHKGYARSSIIVYEIRTETSTSKDDSTSPILTDSKHSIPVRSVGLLTPPPPENKDIELILMNEIGAEREAEVSSRRSSSSSRLRQPVLAVLFSILLAR